MDEAEVPVRRRTNRVCEIVGAWHKHLACAAKLLRLLLFLLTDADLELLVLPFLVRFPVKALGCVRQIRVDVDVLGKNSHQGCSHRSVRAGDAIALYIRDSHNVPRIACPSSTAGTTCGAR